MKQVIRDYEDDSNVGCWHSKPKTNPQPAGVSSVTSSVTVTGSSKRNDDILR